MLQSLSPKISNVRVYSSICILDLDKCIVEKKMLEGD